MNADDQVAERLRTALRAGETALAPRPDLAEETARRGRQQVRRRRGQLTVAGAALAVAAIITALTVPDESPRTGLHDPAAPNTTSVETNDELSQWVASLPGGEPPSVPYLEGTKLHHPGGSVVELPGEDAAIIGMTVKGTLVLVEDTSDGEFTSDYLIVDDETGGYEQIPQSLLGGGAQDEVTSPDGRLFVSGENVIDLRQNTVVATLPAEAAVLVSWTRAGIQYADKTGTEWLWEPGSQPWQLKEPIWFPNQLDPFSLGDEEDAVGLTASRSCTEVVHVYRGTEYDERWGRRCGGSGVVTMSPEGSWLITREPGVVDAVNQTTTRLAPANVGPLPTHTETYWTSDSEVLLALPAGIVRCDVIAPYCERTTDHLARLP